MSLSKYLVAQNWESLFVWERCDEVNSKIFIDFPISKTRSFFTLLHLVTFLLGALPRNGGQVLKKLLFENGCNLADDNDEKFIKIRKMKRRYFTDNLHLILNLYFLIL